MGGCGRVGVCVRDWVGGGGGGKVGMCWVERQRGENALSGDGLDKGKQITTYQSG